MFGIWCTVDNGITGYRAAWLKSNGNRVEFDDFGAADDEAKKRQAKKDAMPFNPHGAMFTYVARSI